MDTIQIATSHHVQRDGNGFASLLSVNGLRCLSPLCEELVTERRPPQSQNLSPAAVPREGQECVRPGPLKLPIQYHCPRRTCRNASAPPGSCELPVKTRKHRSPVAGAAARPCAGSSHPSAGW